MVQGLESILLLGNGSCSYPWILIILLSVAWVSQSNPLHFANWKHLIRMVLYNQESSLQFIHQAGSWSCCNAPLISYTCLSKESALFGDFLFFKFFIFCFDRLWPWKYEFVKQAEKKKTTQQRAFITQTSTANSRNNLSGANWVGFKTPPPIRPYFRREK